MRKDILEYIKPLFMSGALIRPNGLNIFVF